MLYIKLRIVDSGGDTAAIRYEVSKMLLPAAYLTPEYLVRNHALAERARGEGLISVGQTFWCSDPCQPEMMGCDSSSHGPNWCYECAVGDVWWPLQWTRLQGLVCPYGPDIWQKRYAWRTQKSYADLAGNLVEFAPGNSSDGLASVDTTAAVARILVGNYSAATSSALTLVFRHVPDALVVNEAVRVSIARHPGNPDSVFASGVVPDERPEHNYLVVGDSVVVEIGPSYFQPGDALDVEISRIEPDATIAPG